VKRIIDKAVNLQLPIEWDDHFLLLTMKDGEHFIRKTIKKNSIDWKFIKSAFEATLQKAEIKSIEKFMDKRLWK
jgi:hypothetical protein